MHAHCDDHSRPHLSGRLAGCLRHLGHHGVVQQAAFAVAQRPIGNGVHALQAEEGLGAWAGG